MKESHFFVAYMAGGVLLVSAVLVVAFFQLLTVTAIFLALYVLNSLQLIRWRKSMGREAFLREIYPPPYSGTAGEFDGMYYLVVFFVFAPGLILIHAYDFMAGIAFWIRRTTG